APAATRPDGRGRRSAASAPRLASLGASGRASAGAGCVVTRAWPLTDHLARLAQALAAPLLLLVVWQPLAGLGALPAFLSSPLAIADQFFGLLASGEMLVHARESLWRSLAGFGLAAACGVALGLLAGVSPPVRQFFDPLVSLTYPVPKIAVLPVLIVWF